MTDPEIITLGEITIKVIRSRRKSLSLEIGHEGLKARAPMRMRASAIKQFVEQKRSWIEKHLSNRPAPIEPIELENGIKIPLLDQEITLQILANQRGSTMFDGMQLRMPLANSRLSQHQAIRNKLVRWYKQTALNTLEERIEYYAPLMNVPSNKPGEIKVREYKRRWGSCDHLGRLSFNWRIVMAPAQVLDYVVVHELAHCHEFNHSKRFWRIVEKQMPNWKLSQDWLNQNGAQLYKF